MLAPDCGFGLHVLDGDPAGEVDAWIAGGLAQLEEWAERRAAFTAYLDEQEDSDA
jgi:hypothetical protein